MAEKLKELPPLSKELLQQFYSKAPEDVPQEARKILEEYSKIPKEEVLPHVLAVVRPIACNRRDGELIGQIVA